MSGMVICRNTSFKIQIGELLGLRKKTLDHGTFYLKIRDMNFISRQTIRAG